METLFLAILIILLIAALASGYPVAFALPGSAIITILLASIAGTLFTGDSGAYFSQGDAIQWFNAAITNFRGIYFEVERDTLIAIPLFIFMGLMLQRSKVAEDLLITMAQLFGPVPGGLGIAVVFVGALLAATTGIVGATVIAMGLISLPVMLRANYNVPLATGTIAASGTLGQIIPPSIVLIILADQLSSATDRAATIRKAEFKDTTGLSSLPTEFDLTSTSAGEMFLGALLPGLVLVGLYMLYILVVALLKKNSAPPVPFEGKYDVKFFKRVFLVLVPPLVLIFTVLGSIILGIATVNQAGAIGAVGAMIMAGYRLKEGEKHAFTPVFLIILSLAVLGWMLSQFTINVKAIKGTQDAVVIAAALVAVLVFLAALFWSGWRTHKIEGTLNYVMIETAKTTSLVFIILLGAAMLTAAFRAFGGEELVKDFLTGLPGGFITKFVVVMAVIFLLGFFLDFIEIAVVVVPIIAPILLADPSANVTGVWLGVMIGVNMQTSFLTPPFGFALFYLRGVASKAVQTIQIYKGVVPFIILQLIGLAIVGFYPSLVNYLPNRVNLTSDTAPPPINPRLQVCVEEYLFAEYEQTSESLIAAIAAAKTLDLSYLPDRQKRSLSEAFQASDQIFTQVAAIKKASQALNAYIPGYRPLHRTTRDSQARARRL
ncbi:MAG: TRAP transporter large permease subunit, partial [Rhodospirillales bacterium]|nr:TRAP transporter large permease subunit [Rhodospirillales bacterium]